MTRDTILVTGGTGFLGSHFARLAADAGRDVVVLDDLSGCAPSPLPASVPLVVGDIGERRFVTRLMQEHRVGTVAHFAGKLHISESVSDPAKYFDVNLVRTLELLHAMRDADVHTCVFASSAAVYGDRSEHLIPEHARKEPVNPYGSTKLAIELALQAWSTAYGLRWAALRTFNAAGAHPDGTLREHHEPETHLVPRAIDAALGVAAPLHVFGADYDTPDGTCIRDYIHVQDVAAAHLAALARLDAGPNLGAINVGTGCGFSVRDVIETIARVLGRRVPHAIRSRRAGDPPRLVAEPSTAFALLGWKPQCSDLVTMIEDAARPRYESRVRLVAASPQ